MRKNNLLKSMIISSLSLTVLGTITITSTSCGSQCYSSYMNVYNKNETNVTLMNLNGSLRKVILKDGENVIWSSLSLDEVYYDSIEVQRLHIAYLDLRSCDFHNCLLLKGCSFEHCQLDGCDFSGAFLENCNFNYANCSRDVNWNYSMVNGATFYKTVLKRDANATMFETTPGQFDDVIWVN